MDVAIKIMNTCINRDKIHLGTGEKRNNIFETYKYPQGQTIRGVFGYFFLEMHSKLAESWKNAHPIIYFKDLLPLHQKDGGILFPIIVKNRFINNECQACHRIERYPTHVEVIHRNRIKRDSGTVAQAFHLECITRPSRFNFRLIYNLKMGTEHLGDLLGLLKFIEKSGISIGKGGMKGFGKLVFLEKFNYQKITMKNIRKRAKELSNKTRLKVRLISDLMINDGMRDIIDVRTFLRSVKNAGKFFNPEYQPYQDPDGKLVDHETLPPFQTSFLDVSNYKFVNGIHAGASFTYELKNGGEEFYTNLAIAEQCKGLGSRTSFGKGDFVIK